MASKNNKEWLGRSKKTDYKGRYNYESTVVYEQNQIVDEHKRVTS